MAHLLLATGNAWAFNIELVYPGGTLFSAVHDDAAKAAINQAAFDISSAITTNLAAVNTDIYTGSSGQNTVTYNWDYSYLNPAVEGLSSTIENATIAANTVSIYVGARSLLGQTLGEGGPAGMSLRTSYSYFNANQLPAAAANADTQSQLAYTRGGGPVIGTIELSANVAGVTVNSIVDFGIAYGSLALDWDSNNNGVKDTDAQLANYWHFNHETPVAPGKSDLYSVALHEILHAVGVGSSASWDAKVVGTNWTGDNVIDLVGGGAGLINPTGDHIAEGKFSTRWFDGTPQEAVMDPSITQGQRKYLTALDLAFLRDIGYSTVNWVSAPSSPADFNNDGKVDAADLAIWQGGYSTGVDGDANGDGVTDGRDFLVWQRDFGDASLYAPAVVVPEPGALVLIAMWGATLLGCRCATR